MNSDLKVQLQELNITATKKIEVGDGPKAIIIVVPVSQLKSFQKIQVRLLWELEKEFSGKHLTLAKGTLSQQDLQEAVEHAPKHFLQGGTPSSKLMQQPPEGVNFPVYC
ncbi:40S ribosomal protein S7-like protein [Cricetulus griseus]|nr:40S ribosomal protein S7-like protein [Cricetulus griseus]